MTGCLAGRQRGSGGCLSSVRNGGGVDDDNDDGKWRLATRNSRNTNKKQINNNKHWNCCGSDGWPSLLAQSYESNRAATRHVFLPAQAVRRRKFECAMCTREGSWMTYDRTTSNSVVKNENQKREQLFADKNGGERTWSQWQSQSRCANYGQRRHSNNHSNINGLVVPSRVI